MKKLLLLLLTTVILPLFAFTQLWNQNISQAKLKNSENNYFEMRKTFDDYWSPYNVDNKGYYTNIDGVKKKAAGWKQFNRWAWNMEGQINPETGELPAKTAQQVYNEYQKLKPKQSKSTTADWKSMGPNSSGSGYAGVGRINCIAFHPIDNNTYWIGAPAGGLWVTTNDGNTWTCLTDNNNVLGISDIIIPSDYSTSKTIYIATGDRDAMDNYSIGVLKSTDEGLTWNKTGIEYNLSNRKLVNRLLLDPEDNNTLIAATTNGVFKTTDGGDTWTDKLTTDNFIDMEYNTVSFDTLYGSTKNGKIRISPNGGAAWVTTLTNASGRRIELATTQDNSNIIYAVMAEGSGGLMGVYRSDNAGMSFSQVYSASTSNLLGWYSDGSGDGGQGWYDLSIASSPTDSNTVLIGGVNSQISTDGGETWSCSNCWTSYSVYNKGGHPTVHADKHNLNFRSNGDLFECNDGGIYLSTNNGLSWIDKTNGLAISQIYKLGVSQTAEKEIITGLQDNGTKLFSDQTWYDVKGGDGTECIIDYTDKNTQYGAYVYGQISRTKNHWSSNEEIQPTAAGTGAWVTPYIIDPKDNNTLYAGYADVWKTTDQGDSWLKISTISSYEKIRSMAVSPSNSSTLYVADNTHIWKTSNGGTSWSEITNGLPTNYAYIQYIAVKNNDENTIWIALSGYNSYGVYESINGGDSWTNISSGLPQLPAYSIVQDTMTKNTTYLYVGTELGIYFKKGSDNWVEFNTGLPNVKIGEIEIYYDKTNHSNSKLRAASYGRGLWESNLYFSPQPIAEFTASVTTTNIGETITFTDLSTNTPTEWLWSFGQVSPTTSTEQNPKTIYTAAGTYDITLIVINSEGKDTLTKTDYITINQSETPIPGFTTDKDSIYIDQDIQFSDTSMGTPTSWNWTFEGGTPSTSDEQNPIITYSANGNYDVTLVVTNSVGNHSSIIKNKLITVSIWPNPEAYFDAAPLSGVDPLEVTFTDTSKYAHIWLWDFGDDETSTEQNPTHTFIKGTYTISLLVSNPSGENSITKSNLIIVDPNSLDEEIKHRLKVYPNPVTDVISVEFTNENSHKINIEIYDFNGKLVKRVIPSINTNIKQQINIESLDAGNYILKIKIGNDILVQNIVKE